MAKKDRCACCDVDLIPSLAHFHQQWGTVCEACFTMLAANPEFGDLEARARLSRLAKRRSSKEIQNRQVTFDEWRSGRG